MVDGGKGGSTGIEDGRHCVEGSCRVMREPPESGILRDLEDFSCRAYLEPWHQSISMGAGGFSALGTVVW